MFVVQVRDIRRQTPSGMVVDVAFLVMDDGQAVKGSTAAAIFGQLSLLESSALLGYPVQYWSLLN